MKKYYTRVCNFYYGKISVKLVNQKKTIPLNGNKNISFDQIEIISRDSKKLINTILESSNSDKMKFFNKTIKDCLGIVNEQIVDADLSLKESLLSVKENLLNRVFNENSFEVDILKIFQLKKDLNE